jgi:hypothetical protein
MFGTCLDATLLDTENRFVSSFSSKKWVCAEAFPVPSTLGNPCHIHHRTEAYVDPFAFLFLPQEESTGADELTVESKDQKINPGLKKTITSEHTSLRH